MHRVADARGARPLLAGLARAVAVAAALGALGCADGIDRDADAPPPARPGSAGIAGLERCAPVWLRPDRRFSDLASCEPEADEAEIAVQGGVVLFGSFWDVSEQRTPVPREQPCVGPHTHASNGAFVASILKGREPDRAPPIAFVHLHRFELVPIPFAALDGFDAGFLLRTQRPWDDVLGFFARDDTDLCRGGACRWSDSLLGDPSHNPGPRLRDLIDRSGGEGAFRSAVYYLSHSGDSRRVTWPTAALADLRNPAYRAWRVAEARRAVAAGGYDAIMLNDKFSQYRRAGGHWLGSPAAGDVEHLNRAQDTLWSAPPDGYGFSEYVQGWSALGSDLRAAGVPYAVWLGVGAWRGRGADDPRTTLDEGERIRETARGAALVLVGGLLLPGEAGSLEAELQKSGARLVLIGVAGRLGCL